jgi:NAD(P)H-flavin reductase
MEPFSIFTSDLVRPLSDPISDPSQAITARGAPPGTHRDQLVKGFGFSRWFFVTYQAAIIGIVLAATAKKRYETWTRSRRRRIRDERARREDGKNRDGFPKQAKGDVTEGWTSSSSSSTQEGDASSPPSSSKVTCTIESDPLLASDEEKPRRSPAPALQRARRWCRAALMYQPPPLPVINRIIPENETTLWILFLLGLNMFYIFYRVDYSTSTFIEIVSDRSGLMFVANLPWLYLLAAKNQPLKALTGHSYENLNLLHRRQGELMCLLAAMHFFGMIFAWWNFLRPLHLSLYRFLTINYIFWGDFAFLAYELLYFTSLSSFREWWYEMFLASHVFLQTAGLVLLYLHHWRGRPYVLASLFIFVLDRTVWRLGIKTKAFCADLEVMQDGETVKVSADWLVTSRTKSLWRSWLGWNMSYGWETSQHVFLTVPMISKRHTLQFHPMTIASAAPEPGQEHAWFNLIIRAKGGFSRDLLHFAREHSSTKIRLDGPYGSLHALEMLHASDVSIIVAGGSGIAVAYPMLWSLLHSESHHKQQICLIWVIQEASHIKWLGAERLDELRTLGLHVVIPSPSRTHGRPDVAALVCDSLHALAERAESIADEPRIGVVVSGPDGLNRSVRNTCAELVRKEGMDIDVAVEKFGW